MTQFNIVLFEPEIPPNTGNIMRLCSAASLRLHLIEPLGFTLDDKQLKRASLDYILDEPPTLHANIHQFLNTIPDSTRVFLCTTKAQTIYSDIQYQFNDTFIFGPETRGLPSTILDIYPMSQKIKIPMRKAARSLNLANAVSIIAYEALRQTGFSF